jgi:hypothetical protein
MIGKLLVTTTIVGAALVGAPKTAKADECLEVGWRDRAGAWVYHRAWVDAEDSHHMNLHYDFHHGLLELKVFEKEKADGEDVIVLKGRWYEGRDAQRSGKVRMELKRGHHTAHGWYTFGDSFESDHFDFALRDCRR